MCVCVRRVSEGNGEAEVDIRGIPSAFSSLHLCSCVIFRYLQCIPLSIPRVFNRQLYRSNRREFAWVSLSLTIERERERQRETCVNTNWNARTLYSYFRPTIYRYLSSIESLIGNMLGFLFTRPKFLPFNTGILLCLVSFGCRTWSERIEFPSGMNSWRLRESERERETDVCRHDGTTSYEQGPTGS